jgi:predicted phosphohydrolase
MKIQYASDLHLEFQANKRLITYKPLKPVGEVLLLAGDIVPFAIKDDQEDFFDYVSDNFEATYWVPGNHEYYHYDLSKKSGMINEQIRKNVWLVNNVSIKRGDVRFLFSTLWTKIGMANRWPIEKGMADFHAIAFEGFKFTTFNYNDEHRKCLNFLESELDIKAEKTIVVSHHVPTFINYPPKYLGSVLNEAFAVELSELIEQSNIDYWIYGHHHQHVPTFKIGKTSLINNQLGYVQYGENVGFEVGAIIEL